MSKLGVVKKGWKLLAVMPVSVEPAKFYNGRFPVFEASVLSPDGKVMVKSGGWRGGERWSHSRDPISGLSGI